jgi:tRNA-specific 2-thiouridylase
MQRVEKIGVLMSGGVDSSVVALLLKQQGYFVFGITMQITNDDTCIVKAKKVCDEIGIEHKFIDLRADFQRDVLNYFKESYENGETPNPCVVCNEKIKFRKLYEFAKQNGADKIATGHYSIIEVVDGDLYLKKSTNIKKDQSYFLSRVDEDILKDTIFPLGKFDKEDVRAMAEEFNLPPKIEKDSQDICFLSNTDYKSFLKEKFHIREKKGNFINENGEIIGRHSGIHNYTIGQRKGLGAFGQPMIVKKINNENFDITLCEKGNELFGEVVAQDIKIFSAYEKLKHTDLNVKIRYSNTDIAVEKVVFKNNSCKIIFKEPQRAVTPGQFIVCYSQNIVIFNGKIV